MAKLVVTLLSLVLFVLPGCATSTNDNSGTGITADAALSAMDKYVAAPVGKDAKAYLTIAMNYVEKNSDTLVSIDEKYFPPEYRSLDRNNRSHLLGAYVTGNARYQLRNGVIEDRPDDGIRLMIDTYWELVSTGRMRQYESFSRWLEINNLN